MSSFPRAILLGKLNRVAIATPNLQKSTDFYKSLGAEIGKVVALPHMGLYTVFIELQNSKIELLLPYGNNSPIQAFLNKNKDGGIHHITIEVNDIHMALEAMKMRGIRTLHDKPKDGAHGKPIIFLHPKDCGGVMTQLEQD